MTKSVQKKLLLVPFAEKAISLSLQQTLKEALRVAAAQRQLQKSKAKNNNNGGNSSGSVNGNNSNALASSAFPLFAPFILPGIPNSFTFSTN